MCGGQQEPLPVSKRGELATGPQDSLQGIEAGALQFGREARPREPADHRVDLGHIALLAQLGHIFDRVLHNVHVGAAISGRLAQFGAAFDCKEFCIGVQMRHNGTGEDSSAGAEFYHVANFIPLEPVDHHGGQTRGAGSDRTDLAWATYKRAEESERHKTWWGCEVKSVGKALASGGVMEPRVVLRGTCSAGLHDDLRSPSFGTPLVRREARPRRMRGRKPG